MNDKDNKPPWGRRIALGIYIVGLVYIIGVGLVSVIPQAFWPEKETDSTRVAESCREGLGGLYMEVRQFVADAAAQPDSPPDDRAKRSFFEDWDRRFAAYRERCDKKACTMLDRYRYRSELSLDRLQREDEKLARSVESVLPTLSTDTP